MIKRVWSLIVILCILMALAACNNGEPYDFNLPTIEGPYDFRVRYFSWGTWWDKGPLELAADLYAEERTWLKERPELGELNISPSVLHEDVSVEVVTSMDELAEEWHTKYAEDFFEYNYLVIIHLIMGGSMLQDVVYRIKADGAIVFRPLLNSFPGLTVPSHWTVIIELDNHFQTENFHAVFISNPWIS